MKWHCIENGTRRGPVDDAAMESLIREKAVTPDTLVWNETLTGWIKAGQTELAHHFQAEEPAPPPVPPPTAPQPPPPPSAKRQSGEQSFYRFLKNPISLVAALASGTFCMLLASKIINPNGISVTLCGACGMYTGNFIYDALNKNKR